MSGGSFNYACFKAEDTSRIFEGMEDYRAIEAYLRQRGRHDAADEVMKFVLVCETAQRRLLVQGKRIAEILRAAEWTASGDTGIEAVDAAFAMLDVTQAPRDGEEA